MDAAESTRYTAPVILFAILFGLLSMVCYGLANAFSQSLAKRLGPAQFLFLRGLTIVAMLAVVCIPTYAHSHNWPEVLFAFGIGFTGYLPPLAFMHGLRVSKIGIVAPIANAAPLITVLLSFFILNVPVHGVQWLAIALIVTANAATAINFRDFRQSNLVKLESGVPYGMIAALLWGAGAFLMIYPNRAIGPWQTALFAELGVTVAACIHVLMRRERIQWRETTNWRLIRNGVLIALGTLAFGIGVSHFNIGIVASLSNANAVVSALAAVAFYHEVLTRREKITAAILAIGIISISIT